ncbi:MAG: NnrS family protein [Magnetococcus sp. YQC-3]
MQQQNQRQFVLLAYGFRPFFLAAGLWSLGVMTVWLLLLEGHWQPTLYVNPAVWHAHEMLYGFVAASAAGFLLTASPNWSRKPALKGTPLLLLLLCWLAGRLALSTAPWLSPWIVALLDMLFPVALVIATGPTLWFTGNPVHRIFPLLLGLMAIGNGLVHAEAVGLTVDTARRGLYLGVDTIVFFLVMVGGHIMPMFTRNVLQQSENLPPFKVVPALEIAGAVTMVGVILGDLFNLGEATAAPFLVAAALVQGIRLSQWHGLKTLQVPLLWVLHLGYAWLVLGLFIRGLAQLTGFITPSAALHALTVGAMGLFTLGIMSRVSLAHTGRPLVAQRALTAAYLLVAAAAIVRVFGTGFWPIGSLLLSGLLWISAFFLFLSLFLPVLMRKRPDGMPG